MNALWLMIFGISVSIDIYRERWKERELKKPNCELWCG